MIIRIALPPAKLWLVYGNSESVIVWDGLPLNSWAVSMQVLRTYVSDTDKFFHDYTCQSVTSRGPRFRARAKHKRIMALAI